MMEAAPSRGRGVVEWAYEELMALGAMTLPGGKLWNLAYIGIVVFLLFCREPFFSVQSVISLVTCTSFTALTPAGVYRLKNRRNILAEET